MRQGVYGFYKTEAKKKFMGVDDDCDNYGIADSRVVAYRNICIMYKLNKYRVILWGTWFGWCCTFVVVVFVIAV